MYCGHCFSLSLLVFPQIHGELVGSDALEVKLNLLKSNKTEIYFNCLCCGSTFSHSLSLSSISEKPDLKVSYEPAQQGNESPRKSILRRHEVS